MRRKSKKQKLGIVSKSLLGINFLVAGLLLLSYLASLVDPQIFWPLAFLGLAYPWLLLINFLLAIIWLFRKPSFALLSVISILIGWKFLVTSIGFRESNAIDVPKSSENFIRVMTYNVHYFKKFNSDNDKQIKDQMLDVIRREQPDVICIQEFMTRKRGEYNVSKSLKKILQTNHYYFVPSEDNDYEAYGLAIFSKYPIKDTGHILFPNTSRGNEAIFVDIKIGEKQLRVYNVHLQSINFQREDYQYLKEVTQEITNIGSSRRIGSRLKRAFLKRSEQVKVIKAHASACENPYIIAGDFNDTPASFAVNSLSKGMKNSFREKGSGFGITYNGDFPNFQIDYILTTSDFDIKSYRIINKKLSDHYAVRSDVEIRQE